MHSEANIIQRCKQQDPLAQKALYDKFSPVLYGICLRYLKNTTEAEDVLIESFYKIFNKINQFKSQGSFEGWMKRIVINESLMKIRKKNNLSLHVEIEKAYYVNEKSRVISDINYKELLQLLEDLPTGYRTIFNLYVIEGYKHREIAEKLGISINTSKSQLILAKKKMRDLYKKKHNLKIS
ncbi:MAG: sigma-70 family RNA polymerase sigma factor [Saprospiraceae bacterium]|nr:sigma-70 family RNA polymerase sigma factor [Bacteroidia bacterium]NNL91634.1 sigma-70 family RNA polymerase sigma factor [Saprospiraceae bacterium]